MKSTLFLGSFLLSSLVAAAPVSKREIVWQTVVHEVVETVEVTSTVWVDPATATSSTEAEPTVAATTPGAFFEQPKSSSVAAYTPVETPTPSSSSVVVEAASSAPAYTPPASSTPVYTPPASSTPVYTPPASSTPAYTPPAAPSTTETPTPVYTSEVVYTPSSTSAAPAATTSASSGGNTGTMYSGDITYYNPAGGYGACGWTISDSDAVVALAAGMMGAQSNGNPWCGKKIAIVHNGKTTEATIGDKCPGCSGQAIDLTQGLWSIVAPDVDGRGTAEWYVIE